jgi:hypothetical protein
MSFVHIETRYVDIENEKNTQEENEEAQSFLS